MQLERVLRVGTLLPEGAPAEFADPAVLFDVTAARDHFDGTVEARECRFCAFDARNREHHARNAGRLF